MDKTKVKKRLEECNQKLDRYDSVLNEAEKTFRELNSRNMQATLIQIEDFLDSNNLYAFNNWFEGIIWDGPDISRHWVVITLKYPYLLMPEPRGMKRFMEMGVKFIFREDVIYTAVKVQGPDDLDPTTRKPKEKSEKIWLITLKIPRHLIEDPLPNDTEEPDTLQNIMATNNAEQENSSSQAPKDEDALDIEEGGGNDLEL